MTWDQLSDLRWGELERLTSAQVAAYVDRVWPRLATLEPTERRSLVEGFLDGSLPPALVADGQSRYSKVQQTALALWTTFKPQTEQGMAAYLGVIVATVAIIASQCDDDPPPTPTPDIHIHIQQELPT